MSKRHRHTGADQVPSHTASRRRWTGKSRPPGSPAVTTTPEERRLPAHRVWWPAGPGELCPGVMAQPFERVCQPGPGAGIEAGCGQVGPVYRPVEVGFVQQR